MGGTEEPALNSGSVVQLLVAAVLQELSAALQLVGVAVLSFEAEPVLEPDIHLNFDKWIDSWL